jgi:hypothetical protein
LPSGSSRAVDPIEIAPFTLTDVLSDHVAMRRVDDEAVTFWRDWWTVWHREIGRSKRPSAGARRRPVRAIDVYVAWVRIVMPALDPEYVAPDWWLALSDEAKRAMPRPPLILRGRPVAPASERRPGFSLDDVGPYLKLPDGTVCRDRKVAAHRLWRVADRNTACRQVIDMLPARKGQSGQVVKGRTARRVLDALACLGLVQAGMTQIDAADSVLAWAKHSGRDPKRFADDNRSIWRELRLPLVSA